MKDKRYKTHTAEYENLSQYAVYEPYYLFIYLKDIKELKNGRQL